VGRQPTFNKDAQSPVVVETHILGFDRDIYGSTLEVRMVARLRDEVRFDGIDKLVAQIKIDVEKAKTLL
jgi:riboflavin kinase/FMN adenylyltransferase